MEESWSQFSRFCVRQTIRPPSKREQDNGDREVLCVFKKTIRKKKVFLRKIYFGGKWHKHTQQDTEKEKHQKDPEKTIRGGSFK